MKITFEDSIGCVTQKSNGDINITPKFIAKFGHIVAFIDENGEARAEPKDFVFDGKGTAVGMEIEIPPKVDLDECAICGCKTFHIYEGYVCCDNCAGMTHISEVNIKKEWKKRDF